MRLRALVTDAEQRSTLAACRALHEAGYLVSTVATERPALTHWSRCNDERLEAPNPRETVSGFARRLAEIVASQKYTIVLPGSDASLIALSEHRAALEPHVSLGLPEPEVIARALDKLALLQAAENAGLPAPASVVCSDPGEASEHAARLGFPLILKPARSFLRDADALRQRTAQVVRTEQNLATEAPTFGTPFILQRYEPRAPILSCTGVITADGVVALAVARYFRTWPIEAGPSCFSETVEPPPRLGDRVEALLQALGWRGIFQLQLLELDNRPATLDFNGRIFGSLELALAAGANLPAIWAEIVRGNDVKPVMARPGVRYRWEEGDARHFIRQLQRRRLRAAAVVLAPHRRVAHAYFRLRDPAPLAAAFASAVLRRVRRRVG